MKEVKEDVWGLAADWICIPTNGIIKGGDRAVMGAGFALEAKEKFKTLDQILATQMSKSGNRVHFLMSFMRPDLNVTSLYSFPTKNHYREQSSLRLIEDSCKQILEEYTKQDSKPKVVIPAPGCGCGGLDWETQVKPICEKYFTNDDFIICFK